VGPDRARADSLTLAQWMKEFLRRKKSNADIVRVGAARRRHRSPHANAPPAVTWQVSDPEADSSERLKLRR
jgi:hypothetical protein